ncbi:MAG: heme o synthase [Chlamydiia bacterium]|nr:heme o synthase [Chlamydiia bacterium]
MELSKVSMQARIKTYISLVKPGIIFGNALTAAMGFTLGARGSFDFWLFLATLEGISLVIASACAFNNYIDRDLDKKMERTKNRPLARGEVSPYHALGFAAILGALGLLILALYTNRITMMVALLGVIVYVFAYSLLKYHTIHGTLIGSIAGAVPPVVGYCAVTNQIDWGASILFAMIALWQMPHFFAISIFRLKDYMEADLPLYPVKKGMRVTKIHMLYYILLFMISAASLTFMGYTGYAYLFVVIFLSLSWLVLCIKGFKCKNDQQWARQMFIFSLVIVTALCIVVPFSVL